MSLRTLWLAFALTLFGLCVGPAQADYMVSERFLVEQAMAVVDATVVSFDEKGHARLSVHATWAGALKIPVLKSVRYTCLMGSARDAGLTVGGRYVILIDAQNNLFEETSAYEVKGDAQAGWQVKGTDFSTDWQPRAWMPRAAFKAALLKVRGR